MCCVDIPGVCFGDGFCFDTAFAALVSLLLSCAKLTQGDVLLFFFTKKKKRSKKRKDLAYPCSERQCMPRLAVFSQLTRNINPPEGQQAASAAVTLPFLTAKLGGRVSGGLLSLGKSAVAISAGRRTDPPPVVNWLLQFLLFSCIIKDTAYREGIGFRGNGCCFRIRFVPAENRPEHSGKESL